MSFSSQSSETRKRKEVRKQLKADRRRLVKLRRLAASAFGTPEGDTAARMASKVEKKIAQLEKM